MKWIKVVDPGRELPPGGPKMRRMLYNVIRETAELFCTDTVLAGKYLEAGQRSDEILKRMCVDLIMYDKVRTGELKTVTDVWECCEQWYLPWLKEHGYILTDRPFKKKRRFPCMYTAVYHFLETRHPVKLGGSAGRLYLRYAGKSIVGGDLFEDLIHELSPSGKRTMWEVFQQRCRPLLILRGLLRIEVKEAE